MQGNIKGLNTQIYHTAHCVHLPLSELYDTK